jgi:transposase
MDVLFPRCAGLDVHRDTVVACRRIIEDGKVCSEIRTFGTTTTELLALSDWLAEKGVTHVAMEATGVYWKPVWHVLEGEFELILANAMHIKNVPGRKTDVKDAAWISDLLAHGLIRASFVPPRPVQELRALTRTRKQLIRERTSHVQRLDKLLQDANIKLGSVISNIVGRSGRNILEGIIRGEDDPQELATWVDSRIRAKHEDIVEALRGAVTANHRFLLKLHLDQVDALQAAIDAIDKEVGDRLAPFREQHVGRLTQIPGVSLVVASAIVSELGVDMSRFPTIGHLISWAGLCPRSDESAGKRRSTRIRKGAPWLKTLLLQSALAAARVKGTYLQAQFQRLKARRGPKKAIVAVAASILTAAYAMLGRDVDYVDLTADHFNRTERSKVARRLLTKLGALGYDVSAVRPPPEAAA